MPVFKKFDFSHFNANALALLAWRLDIFCSIALNAMAERTIPKGISYCATYHYTIEV